MKMKDICDSSNDVEANRVYQAEAGVFPETRGRALDSLSQVTDFLEGIFRTTWFRNRFPEVKRYKLHDGRGQRIAWAELDDDFVCHISLPKIMREPLMILHELAHCLTSDGHGRYFAATYLQLVHRFLGFDASRDLRDNFVAARVKHRLPRRKPRPTHWDELTPL